MKLNLNEQPIDVNAGTSLMQVRNQKNPAADVLIYNGAVVTDDVVLAEGDSINLIQRGEIPPAE